MRKSDRGLVFQDLDRLFRRGTVASGDGALLESFLAEGNESAFEALVNRHGPMVRGVCRRLLFNPHDADDAFQATFLVLVRKGGRLRDPDRLGPWLHGVATREALKARAARRRDQSIVDVPSREGGTAEWSDVMPIIDAELARLPAKHRDVLVVCLLDGATAEEASHRLDCPVGTVKSRLARARETLRARLTSRGVAPAAALAILETTDAFAFASPISSALTRATLKTVTTKAVAPGVVALIKGVAPTMLSKSTFTALVLTGVGFAGLGTAIWIRPSLAQVHLPQAQNQSKATAPAETQEARDTIENLKKVLVAVHSYASKNNTLPPAAIYTDGDYPRLSWRVALLPYLGQNELYKQFHLNEDWDSPHNKALVDRMPAVFETPSAPAPKGHTRIRGFVGHGAVFDPGLTPPALGYGGMNSMMMNSTMGGSASMGGDMAQDYARESQAVQEKDGGEAIDRSLPGTRARSGGAVDPGSAVKDASEARATAPKRGVRRKAPQHEPNSAEAGDAGMMMGMMGSAMEPSSGPIAKPRGVSTLEITDGMSNTAFAALARDATPWTKPGDLPFVPGQDLPALDDRDPRGYILGMCDGSIRLLKKDAPWAAILDSLITRSGGEIPSTEAFVDASEPSMPSKSTTPTSTPSVEQRLEKVEEKLDRLLEKLDAR